MGKRKAENAVSAAATATAKKAAAKAARPKAKAKAKDDAPVLTEKEKEANKQFWDGFKKVKQEHVFERDPIPVDSSQSQASSSGVEPVGIGGALFGNFSISTFDSGSDS